VSWVIVGVGLGAASLASSVGMGFSQAAKAKEIGKLQSARIEKTAKANRLQAQKRLNHALGYNEAAVATSDILMSGSARRYQMGLESEAKAEMAWNDEIARMDARIARKGGQAQAQAAIGSAVGEGIRYAGSVVSQFYTPATPAVTPTTMAPSIYSTSVGKPLATNVGQQSYAPNPYLDIG